MVEKLVSDDSVFGWTVYSVGDLVTRDGTDVHKVIEVHGNGQMITVECVREPLGFLQEDGVTRGKPWAEVGETEQNLARRYEYAGELLDQNDQASLESN